MRPPEDEEPTGSGFDFSTLATIRSPPGHLGEPGEDLSAGLYDSSQSHAHAALESFTRQAGESTAAAMHAAVAVELMAKSVLSELHAALLVDFVSRDLDSLLRLCGLREHVHKHDVELKTVGGIEAIRRIRHIYPSVAARLGDGKVKPLFEVRNAAVHLGIASDAHLRVAVRTMVLVVDALLGLTKQDGSHYWASSYADAVAALRDESLALAKAVVHAKIDSARANLARRMRDVPETARAAVLSVISGQYGWTEDYEIAHDCPVCKQSAWLVCQIWQDEETNGKFVNNSGAALYETVALSTMFGCSACGLELEGDDEIQEVGLPLEIALGSRKKYDWELRVDGEWP